MLTKEEKKKLKEKLPPKWGKKIASSTGFSSAYVLKVMSGSASHVLIEKKALEIASEYQLELAQNETLKNKLLNK